MLWLCIISFDCGFCWRFNVVLFAFAKTRRWHACQHIVFLAQWGAHIPSFCDRPYYTIPLRPPAPFVGVHAPHTLRVCYLLCVPYRVSWDHGHKCVGSAQVCLPACLVFIFVREGCCLLVGALSLTLYKCMPCCASFLNLNIFFALINSNFAWFCNIIIFHFFIFNCNFVLYKKNTDYIEGSLPKKIYLCQLTWQ